MSRLAELPEDLVFFTQITMEAAEDAQFLDAMRKAKILGALVGVEAVTAQGLKEVFKDFNCAGESLVHRLQTFSKHGVHVLGSFIFGLPTDRPDTFESTAALALQADITFAQFKIPHAAKNRPATWRAVALRARRKTGKKFSKYGTSVVYPKFRYRARRLDFPGRARKQAVMIVRIQETGWLITSGFQDERQA